MTGQLTLFLKKFRNVLRKIIFHRPRYKGFYVDNTKVNLGIKNSIKVRVFKKNKNVFFVSCPCHIVHNTASTATNEFAKVCGFDSQDFVIDITYYFDKSTNRKGISDEFCDISGVEYHNVLKHLKVRWISVELSIQRILRLFEPLKLYFSDINQKTKHCLGKFNKLKLLFNDPFTEVYLLFML